MSSTGMHMHPGIAASQQTGVAPDHPGPDPPFTINLDDKLLIVSDVDGTLLDPQGCFPLPLPAFRALLKEQGGLADNVLNFVLASSRTLRELTLLQRLLRVSGPLIAEDGGLLSIPRARGIANATTHGIADEITGDITADITDTITDEIIIGTPAADLLPRLRSLPGSDKLILADMPFRILRELGFRTEAIVERAITSRKASVLLDMDPLRENERDTFIRSAAESGIEIKRGGRWHTAVAGADKGRALRALQGYLRTQTGTTPVTIAIGNEENDHSLLSNAAIPFVIRNPVRGHHPVLAAVTGAYLLEDEGIAGFLEMYRVTGFSMEVRS